MGKPTAPNIASAFAAPERAPAVDQVLAAIDELLPMLRRAEESLDGAAKALPKPSRAEVGAMRDVEQPVTPETFLLARLHFAALNVENACSLLEIDAECFLGLDEAFVRGEYPTDLLPFRELAIGAGHGDLVARESLDAAVAEAQARAGRGAE